MSDLPTKIAFEHPYSDGIGVQFAVRYDSTDSSQPIEFESVDTASFPADKLDWLINSLTAIRAIVNKAPK